MKNSYTVEIFHNLDESGDWCAVKVRGQLFTEGHSLNLLDFANLLKELGVNHKVHSLTDEQMEQQTYRD